MADGPTDFRNNVAHSSYGLSNVDFVRDSGLLVSNIGSARLEFRDSLFYQNQIGLWPTEQGTMAFRNLSFVDHWQGPAIAMDTDGAVTAYENLLLVGRTRSPGPKEPPASAGLGPALHIQYTGLADLKNPTFVNYGPTQLLSAADIFVEFQAQFFLSGVKLVNTLPTGRNVPDFGDNDHQRSDVGTAERDLSACRPSTTRRP